MNDRAPVPASRSLRTLRAAAQDCRACPLGEPATQAVFGEGPKVAALFLVGEQPGDQEDREGHVFVGPAGKLLDRALAAAGIDRGEAFLTNAVKHFGFEERGKRRLHRKPKPSYLHACRPWLDAEMEAVKPRVIVCLGATAAQQVLGPKATIAASRGKTPTSPWGPPVVVTFHPSAILRAPDAEARHATFRSLVDDLARARRLSSKPSPRTDEKLRVSP